MERRARNQHNCSFQRRPRSTFAHAGDVAPLCDWRPTTINGSASNTGSEPSSLYLRHRDTCVDEYCPQYGVGGQRPGVACRRCGMRNWEPELRAASFVGTPLEYSNPVLSRIIAVR